MTNINSKSKYICNTPPPQQTHFCKHACLFFEGGWGGRGVIIAYIFEYFISNAK